MAESRRIPPHAPMPAKEKVSRSSGQKTNSVMLHQVVTQERRDILKMQQTQRTNQREWWSEAQRSYFSAASWPRPARRRSQDKLALGSRHDWLASQIVHNDQSCDGNTHGPQELGLSRATDRPSPVSLPIAGQRPTRRQFVCDSLSKSTP